MNTYSIWHRRTGEWLGEVSGVDSALDARREWVDSFGRTLGIGIRSIRAERLPVRVPA